MKKIGEEGALSINVVVIAAISMIILVIISFLLFQTLNDVRTGTSCQGLDNAQCYGGGDGYQSCSDVTEFEQGQWRSSTADCPEPQFCCVQVTDGDY